MEDTQQTGQTHSGLAETATALTAEAQRAANEAIDALQRLSNHAFDAGEAGLGDLLKVVDAAQTEVSKLLSTLTSQVAGKLGSGSPPPGGAG